MLEESGMWVDAENRVLALTPMQRSVRDYFETGGAIGTVVLAIAMLVGVVWLTGRLSELLRRARQRSIQPDDPKRLFHDVLAKLELTRGQQRFLRVLAKHHAMAHPTTLLLSESFYDRCVEKSSPSPGYRAAGDTSIA
ncbi:MAG: hypothetical protein IH987_21230, partial [Planctomycetes bacterium]|nr:hypothetical protein [Planctomycetota bacterium]